jgi:hypothetical protein
MVSDGCRRMPINPLVVRVAESFDYLWFSMLAAEVTANRRQMGFGVSDVDCGEDNRNADPAPSAPNLFGSRP